MQRLAAWLADKRIRPNAISVCGMLAALTAGVELAATSGTSSDPAFRLLCVTAAGLMLLRLLCNLLDGMVALEGGLHTPEGELYNEVPDRFSDAAVLIGAGYAAGSSPTLGYLATIAAVLTAYIRAVGKGAGAGSDFGGPMDKKRRTLLLAAACLYFAAAPLAWRPVIDGGAWLGPLNLFGLTLLLIALGAAITCGLRTRRIAQTLRRNAHG